MRKLFRAMFLAAVVAVLGVAMGCGEHCRAMIAEEVLRGVGGGACLGFALACYRLSGRSCPVPRKQIALAMRDVKCAIAGGLLFGAAVAVWHVVIR